MGVSGGHGRRECAGGHGGKTKWKYRGSKTNWSRIGNTEGKHGGKTVTEGQQ
jgi:hypothetical protein